MTTGNLTIQLLHQYAKAYKGTVEVCQRCGISFVKYKSNRTDVCLCINCAGKQKQSRRHLQGFHTQGVYGVCKICHQKYLKKSANQKYCSLKCLRSKQYTYRYGVGRCPSCGRFFSKKKEYQKYCSADCAKKDMPREFVAVSSEKKRETLIKERAKRVSQVMEKTNKGG